MQKGGKMANITVPIQVNLPEDWREQIIERLKNDPEANWVRVVRCKDCDWWTKQEDSLQGRCARYGMYPTGYWYCAAARERQEG